jgi:hypothetical protein
MRKDAGRSVGGTSPSAKEIFNPKLTNELMHNKLAPLRCTPGTPVAFAPLRQHFKTTSSLVIPRRGTDHFSLITASPMPVDPSRAPLAEPRAAHATALLIVDMISNWDFPDAEGLAPRAVAIAWRIAALKRRCERAGTGGWPLHPGGVRPQLQSAGRGSAMTNPPHA